MGETYVTGGYSGKQYRILYDGDTPSEEAAARAQAWVQSKEAAFRESFEAEFGEWEGYDDGSAFSRGVDRAKTGAYGRLGTLARSTGDQLGFDWLENLGGRMEGAAREEQIQEAGRLPAPTRWQDIEGPSSFLTYAGETAGGSAVDTAAGIAGALGGGVLGALTGTPFGVGAGVLAGSTLGTAPLFTGGNIQRQEEVLGRDLEGGEYLKALGTGVGQAALNAVADKVLLGMKVRGVPTPAAGNLFVRTGQYGARGVAAEVPTEVGQQLLERAQAGLPIGDDEAIAEYIDAAVGAAVLGGLGGAVQGPFRSPSQDGGSDDIPGADSEAPRALPSPSTITPRRGAGGVWNARTGEGLHPKTAEEADNTLDVLGIRDDDPIRVRVKTAFNSAEPADATRDLLAQLEEYAERTDDIVSRDNARRFIKTTLADVPSLEPRRLLPAPDPEARAPGALPTGPAMVPPAQPGQVRTGVDVMPGLRPEATATLNKDPAVEQQRDNYRMVADAVEAQGDGTINAPQLAKALGISPYAAGNMLRALQDARLISAPGARGARTLQPLPEPATVSMGAEVAGDPPNSTYTLLANALGISYEEAAALLREIQGAGPASAPDGTPDPAREFPGAVLARLAAALNMSTDEVADMLRGMRGAEPEAEVAPEAAPEPETDAAPAPETGADAEVEAAIDAETEAEPEAAPAPEPEAAVADPRSAAMREARENSGTGALYANTFTPETRRAPEGRNAAPGSVRDPLTAYASARQPTSAPVRGAPRSAERGYAPSERAQQRSALRRAGSAARDKWQSKLPPEALRDYETAEETAGVSARADAFTAGDYAKLTTLVSKPERGPQRRTAAEAAAGRFFTRFPRPETALEMIAANIAIEADRETGPMYEGLTARSAREAAAWVEENLSSGARGLLRANMNDYHSVRTPEELDLAALPGRIAALEAELEMEKASNQPDTATITALEAQLADMKAQQTDAKLDADRAATDANFRRADGYKETYGRKSVYVSLRSPLHPYVVAALRSGNLARALQHLSYTARSPRMARLAAALQKYTADTAVEVVPDTDPRLQRGLTDKYAYGAFLPGENRILIAERALGYESVLLHEGVHMATERELQKPNSPVRRRLEAIMKSMADIHGEELPGVLTDVNEFAAEALTNGQFQEALDMMGSRDSDVSLWAKTKRVLGNFIRRLMGMPPITSGTGSGFTGEIAELIDGVLSTAPVGAELSSATPRFSTMQTPEGIRQVMSARAPEMTQEKFTAVLRNIRRSDKANIAADVWRATVVPMRNLTMYARKVLPMSQAAWEVITAHHRTAQRRNAVLDRAVRDIAALLPKDREALRKFDEMATRASIMGIDPRTTRARAQKLYNSFSMRYRTENADGSMGDMQYQFFATAPARNAAVRNYNDALKTNRKRLQARAAMDPDTDKMSEWEHLHREYTALTPDARKAYDKMLAYYKYLHGETARVLKRKLELLLPHNEQMRRDVYDELYNKIFNENSLVAYIPLVREGRYWVTYSATDPVSDTTEVFKQVFETPEQQDKALELLRADPKASQVEAHVTPYKRRGTSVPGDKVSLAFVRDTMSAVEQALKPEQSAAVDPGALKEIRDNLEKQISKLALSMMPETSFMQSYRRREGVRGAIGDPGLLESLFADPRNSTLDVMRRKGGLLSRQLANVEFGAQAQAVASEMVQWREQRAKENAPREELEDIDGYMRAIIPAMQNIFKEKNALVRGVNTAAYAWTLALNPSSAFMNLTSIPVFIAPYLSAGRGLPRTYKALDHAMKVLAASGRDRTVDYIKDDGTIGTRTERVGWGERSLENNDLGAFNESANYAAGDNRLNHYGPLQQALLKAGMFSDSLIYDVLEADNIANAGIAQRASKVGAWMMHTTESLTREITAIAAFDLRLQDMAAGKAPRADGSTRVSDKMTAADLELAASEAVVDVEMTNGTIPAAGAPRAGTGNMTAFYMFKRHPLAMLNLLATTAKEGFFDKAELKRIADDPEKGVDSDEYAQVLAAHRLAKLQFASIFGHLAALSGIAGIPLVNGFAAVLSAVFQDDDDPTYMEQLRAAIGELGYYGIANYITGGAMSGRIGLGGAIYRAPLGAEDQSPLWNLLEGSLGPVVGLPVGAYRRASTLYENGEYWRMWEALAPAQVRNVMRGVRYGTEGGALSTRGDMIAELGVTRAVLQGLGLGPAVVVQTAEANSAIKRMEEAINSKRTQLLRKLNVARRSKDRAGMRAAREAIREYNAEYPEKRITRRTERQSWDTFQRTTGEMVDGVRIDPKLRRRLEAAAPQSESSSSFWEWIAAG